MFQRYSKRIFYDFLSKLTSTWIQFYPRSQSHTPLKYQENQTFKTFVLHLTVSAHAVLCKLFMSLGHAKSSIKHTNLVLRLSPPCFLGNDVAGKRVSMREKRWFPTLPSGSQSEPHFLSFSNFSTNNVFPLFQHWGNQLQMKWMVFRVSLIL